MNRREFILDACGALAGTLIPAGLAGPINSGTTGAMGVEKSTSTEAKVIIVIFGGGTRYSESIGDPEHKHIPRLWNELVPRGTLFTNVQVEGRVVHPNCAASILTGHREYDEDNDWSRPVAHPTVLEIFRKARAAPDTAAWAFVYASILANVGASSAAGFGKDYAANVVEPPTISRETVETFTALLTEASTSGSANAELEAARQAAALVRSDSRLNSSRLRSAAAREFVGRQFATWKTDTGTTSHDAFLTQTAIACMRRFAPNVLTVAYGEIDCAHYGSWSRYVEAIQRTDELTWRLWQAAEELPAYQDHTLMLILPDHGRELERPGGLGYVHHSDFYTKEGEDEGCRKVWMLLTGPRILPGRSITREVAQTSAAATALEHLGLAPSPGATSSVLHLAQ